MGALDGLAKAGPERNAIQCLDAAPSPRKDHDLVHHPHAPAAIPGRSGRTVRPRARDNLRLDRSGKRGARREPDRIEQRKDGSDKHDRLQKVLAHAGLGSRRGCEQLILQGRVSINGAIVRELGTRVDPATARIAVDGEPIKLESMVYYAVNKPKGYISTNSDPSGRPRVADLLPEIPERIYTVGRLDEASTGLLLMTNDGELANKLAHPRYGVEKLYRALVAGLPTPEMITKLTEGVWLSDGKVRAKRARIVSRQGQATVLELVLAEGKKREIRRMLSKLGHKVMSLNRIAVGPITLKGLAPGACRPLSKTEIELLQKVAAGIPVAPPRFFDGDSSSRPKRPSHRSPGAEPQPRSKRNENRTTTPRPGSHADHGPARPHHASKNNAFQSGGNNRPRSPRPSDSSSSSPRRPDRHRGPNRPGAPRPSESSPAPRCHDRPGPPRSSDGKRPPRPSPKSRPKTGHPNQGARPESSIPSRPEPLKLRRRIIGMNLDADSASGPDAPGASKRKRPIVRKRKPSGPVLGDKDSRGSRTVRPGEDD